MDTTSYIQLILPLKLEWIPYYRVSGDGVRPSVGDKVRVRFAGREYVGVVYRSNCTLPKGLPESKVQTIIGVETSLERIPRQTIALWEMMADYYMCTVGEVYKAAFPAAKIAQELIQKRKSERRKKKGVEEPGRPERKAVEEITLTEAQNTALNAIRQSFAAGKPALLHGVTGSGKTEIYCTLAKEVMERGDNVLYLVPEIALSRQLEQRLDKCFGDSLMVFHSHESMASRGAVASRVATWKSGEQGGGYIVLGTRSALFLPHGQLSLIIVDEEHDSSYKQDSPAPRYNGRDVALMMGAASRNGAACVPVLLGSATPSLESLYNCSCGKFTLVTLSERYYGAEEADMEIIDTIAERKKRGMRGDFSLKLIDRINAALGAGSQVMLLRSRRAYSPLVQCVDCGDIPRCPHCNVTLSYHKTGHLRCHHCGYSVRYEGHCTVCGGTLKPLGAGTQKIEEEAQQLWPSARIARLDSDVGAKKGREEAIIRDFAAGNIDMLIGTQMVTKGFDFAGLGLVAVIGADSLLSLQDFRADEKAVQLLEQFRGRCGRRSDKGLFVIQTASPQHPAYACLNSPDAAASLLAERKDFGYPPYRRLIEITVRGKTSEQSDLIANSLANELYVSLDKYLKAGEINLVGPYNPYAGENPDSPGAERRMRLSLARSRNLAAAKAELRCAVGRFTLANKCADAVIIDVDPA